MGEENATHRLSYLITEEGWIHFPTSNPQQIWAWGRPKPLPVDAVRPPSRFRRLVLYSTLRRGIGSDDVDAAVTVM